MEVAMITFVKWIFMLMFAGLAWLVGMYTVEYYRPFKKIDLPKYK